MGWPCLGLHLGTFAPRCCLNIPPGSSPHSRSGALLGRAGSTVILSNRAWRWHVGSSAHPPVADSLPLPPPHALLRAVVAHADFIALLIAKLMKVSMSWGWMCMRTEIASLNCLRAVNWSTKVLSVRGPHRQTWRPRVPFFLRFALQRRCLGSDSKGQSPARAATMPGEWVHVCKPTSATDYGVVGSSYSTHGNPAVHDDEPRA